ncbi:MAG: hypothetical protein ACE5HH_01235, partial [Candidatus Hydrothermarchaeales archaeon]
MAKVEDLIGLALLAGFAFLSLGVYAQASDCVTCHNETASSGNAVIDVPAMNLSSNASHRNLTEGIINTSTISDEIDKACWACHWNGTDPNTTHPNKTTYTPWLCYDCHANTTGGINTTASKGNYSAPATYSHIPANAMASYTAPTNINTSAQCVECHNNSIGANIDTGGPPENNTINSTVSHYGTNLSLVKNTGANCTYCHVQPNATVRALWGTNVSLSSWPASNTSFRGLIRHETNVSYCDNCHGNLSSSITLHSNQLKKDISVHYAFDWEGDDADEYPPWDLVPGSGRDNRYESCYACHRDGMAFGASSNYKICEDCHLPNGSGPFNYSDRFPSGFGTEDFVLRSDLQPWSTVNREALGIPIIYSHVPYNSIQNSTTDIDVKRNLSGETGETGMSTQSSCFSWNTSNQNGTCHGVGYSARLQATPPADLNEGKEYFMHYGDKQYGSGPRTYYFNETYMNTYIQDYAPNTTDCLWCHNQSNASVRRYWGNAFQVNATNMFGAQNNSDCYSCHTLNNTPPQNFHADGFTFGGGPDCVLCHDIGLTSAADVDVSKMNASA